MACGLINVTLQDCDGGTMVASARACSARATRAEGVPYLMQVVRFTVASSLRVQVGWRFEFEGSVWDVVQVSDVDRWGKTFFDARVPRLIDHCAVPVTIHAQVRHHDCDGDETEQVAECDAVIHKLEAQRITTNDGDHWEERSRIFLETNHAHSLSVGRTIHEGTRIHHIRRVMFLEHLGNLPYAEAVCGEV